MPTTIKLQTVSDLLDKHFFIPSFQRGYRWTHQHVEDLLNDIDEFRPQPIGNQTTWYCLQPLVLKRDHNGDGSQQQDMFRVIDGQQRLTTILLIIHYFNEMWVGKQKINEFDLRYETREQSRTFFNNLEVGDNDLVRIDDSDIDAYHISRAYQAIHEWVKNKGNGFDNNSFQSKFMHKTQVIWYEIDDQSHPIETFIRINMGKIPLTNAELIKALFLQKRNFENMDIAELRQIEIANEWDRMERSLQNDEFWWFLNKDENEVPARIEFLLDIIFEGAKKADTEVEKLAGTDEHATFRYFYRKFSEGITIEEVMELWNSVKDYYLAFEEWFQKPVWFHYIGFLVYCGHDVSSIYQIYRGCPKDEFTNRLKNKIKEELKSIKYSIIESAEADNDQHYTIDLDYSIHQQATIRKLLLFYNLQFIVNQHKSLDHNKSEEIFHKFPFKRFKEEKWDVEHIDSATANTLSKKKDQVEWLKTSLFDIKNIKGDQVKPELENQINQFINIDDAELDFEAIRDELIKIANEDDTDESMKNGIGNLTLLNADINRSYGNALFPTKRRIIIEKDNEGKFIPICTKHVFLKYFDRQGHSSPVWTQNDMLNYMTDIARTVKDFLTLEK